MRGDSDAMFRVALSYENESADDAEAREAMLGWLTFASLKGNGKASYKLASYYLSTPGGYTQAIRYKNIAESQGYFGEVAVRSTR